MEDLIRFEANKVPYVFLDQNNGFIEFKGLSCMEDTMDFYGPILDWIKEYVKTPKDTSVNIDLEFFNTSSAKILLTIIKTLSKVQSSGHKLTVNWLYDEDDEEMKDTGLSFSIMSHVKFNLFPKSIIE